MRGVLLSTAFLACAISASAQNPGVTGSVTNSASMNMNRQTVRRGTKAAAQPPTPVDLPPDTPVVTLKGVCDPAEKSESQDCKTVYTRQQIDKIVAQMAPSAPQALRPQVAIKYVRTLAAAKLAEERKLENNPTVAVQLEKQTKLGRMQVLAKAFYRQIEEAAENPTMTEMQQYYTEHLSQFEEGEVLRLSIPKSVFSPRRGRLDPAMGKAEVDSLRTRAALGYDFDQLQVQAYADLDIKQTPPTTMLTMARRSSMPPDQSEVFDLQPGEVTPVIDSYTNLVILKLVSKRKATFESVSPEIRADLKQTRLQQEIQNACKSVTADFNLQYLGMSVQPPLFTLGDGQSFAQAAVRSDSRKRTTSRRRLAASTTSTTTQSEGESRP